MVRRCEKTAAGYLGFVLFAAACQWLCNPFANVHTPPVVQRSFEKQEAQ